MSSTNNEYKDTNSVPVPNSNKTEDTKPAEPAAYNPTLPDNECEQNDLERLKGDAIGDTLYSERFVLNTILKLREVNKDLQDEDEIERDLCSLWDMTLEEDVVKYLLNHDVLELFANIIKNTEDKRLTEILVGILGNMCNLQQTRNLLTDKKEVIEILLDLSSCMDSLTLEQLMRLFAVIFVKMSDDQIEKWYNLILKSDKFVENISFILNNAANNSLIIQTLETLNAILAKFFVLKLSLATENGKSLDEISKRSFEELFVQPEVIECTIEAYKTVVKENNDKDLYEASEMTEIIHKAKQTFCNIHGILTQYQQLSRDAYESSNDEILKCFKDILQPMAEGDSITLWQQYEQDVLETLNDVLRVLPQPLDLDIFKYLLKLLHDVDKAQERQQNKSTSANDFESEDEDDAEIDHQISYTLISNTLYYLILKADKEKLKQYLAGCPQKYSVKLLGSFEQPLETEYMKNCYQKLKEALE